MVARKEVPRRLMDALDRGDAVPFLRFWSALPPTGREHHPLGAFIWAAMSEIGEQRMDGAQLFATDQRSSANDIPCLGYVRPASL